MSKVEFTDLAGEMIVGSIESMTNEVYYHADETIKSIHKIFKKFKEIVKEIYPKEKFIDFKIST
jgi:hypothetical protein